MAKAAVRQIDAEENVENFYEAPQIRAMPALVDGADRAMAGRSAARELQERLNREFSGAAATRTYPEPYVEKFSPGVSLMIIVGGAAILWAALAVGANLALR